MALAALVASVAARPAPQLDEIVGSITNPSAGNDNSATGNVSGLFGCYADVWC